MLRDGMHKPVAPIGIDAAKMIYEYGYVAWGKNTEGSQKCEIGGSPV